MHTSNLSEGLRRSSRVEAKIPVLVTSLEPNFQFSEMCETLVVSPHGCAVRSPMRLEAGVPVQFQIPKGRATTAHVVDCQPIGFDQGWRVAARLDHPENCWGLKSCPEDWAKLPGMFVSGGEQPVIAVSALTKPVPLKVQLLRAQVAELVEPLRAEVAELKVKLARGDGNHEAKRNRFEVSLSQIPPEVEEKLWVRLRQDLGSQLQQQTRDHAGQILGAAQETIQQKFIETQEKFRQLAGQELQSLEQRARDLFEEIGSHIRQRVRAEIDEIRQQAEDAGTRLEQQGGALLQAMTEESSRLQAELRNLSNRTAKLDESCRRLEENLDTRLQQLTDNAVSRGSNQLETTVEAVLSAQLERAKIQIHDDLNPLLDQARSLVGDSRSTLESLRAENDHAIQQIATVGEEKHKFQQWMSAQTSAYKAELGNHLEQSIREAASGAAIQLEQQLKVSLAADLEQAKDNLNRALDSIVGSARSLESTLIQETGAWLAQQGVNFRKTMLDELRETHGQITAQVKRSIEEVTTHATRELGNQLEDSSRRLYDEARENFKHSIEDVAHESVERWRLALARNLDSFANTLAEPLRAEAASDQQQDG